MIKVIVLSLLSWGILTDRVSAVQDKDEQRDQAVQKGLEYLARNQDPQGSWPAGENKYSNLIATTSIAVLSFLSEGSTPEEGKYKDNVKKGLNFLLGSFGDGGKIIDKIKGTQPQHEKQVSCAILALIEVHARTSDAALKRKSKAAVDNAIAFLNKAQIPGGGWDYKGPSSATKGIISDTSSALIALGTAKANGFAVQDDAISKGVSNMLRCANPDGSFKYDTQGKTKDDHPANEGMVYFRAAAVLLALDKSGRSDAPEAAKTKEYLTQKRQTYMNYAKVGDMHAIHAYWLASIWAKTQGGEEWNQWYATSKTFLVQSQQSDGTWKRGEPDDKYWKGFDAVTKKRYHALFTAINTFVLQVPLGRLKTF